MEKQFAETFQSRWARYFGNAELPIVFYYTDQPAGPDVQDTKNEERCLIGNLNRVRSGHSFVYSAASPGCTGGKRYTGMSDKLRPNFEYFLSCGIPGKMQGERYKKSPELVKQHLQNHPPFQAPARYLVFKRWDKVLPDEQPVAVVFFATADVLSGLFTWANYDEAGLYGVVTPMGSGCSSIVNYPLEESESDHPRCVLGMFDVSARPCVPENTLTFTVPFKRFVAMVGDMDESFLITTSWKTVQRRIKADKPA